MVYKFRDSLSLRPQQCHIRFFSRKNPPPRREIYARGRSGRGVNAAYTLRRAAAATNVPYVPRKKLSPVKFTVAAGAYSLCPRTRHTFFW